MPIVTRTGKGSKLTIAEMDGNFTQLQSSSFQDGTYSQTLDGTGAIIQLAGIRQPSVASGSAGTYVVSPTTSGTGVGASLQLVIIGTRLPLTLSLSSSSILDGGTGYASGDEIYVPYTDLGSAGSGSLTLTLADANISIDKSSVITATTASLSLSTAVGDRALDGAIVSLIDAEVSSFFSGTTGSYAIEVSSDTGDGGVLNLVVTSAFNTYSIDLANSSVIESGTGYVVGDSFDIPVTSLGGSSDEIVTITLVDGNVGVIDKSTLYLGPLSGMSKGSGTPSAILSVNAIAISIVDDPNAEAGGQITMVAGENSLEMSVNGGLQISTPNTDITGPFSVSGGVVSFSDLPTTDPQSAGQLWVDAANDYVLKVSQG